MVHAGITCPNCKTRYSTLRIGCPVCTGKTCEDCGAPITFVHQVGWVCRQCDACVNPAENNL